MNNRIVTRFAPSPTGSPHIGNIRTAIFAWVLAMSNKGKFFLRIEDTDKKREREGAVESIIESLEWLGLDFDKIKYDSPKLKENKKFDGVVFQSDRLDIYKKYAKELILKGRAYICNCSEEMLNKLRESQLEKGLPTMYNKKCRSNRSSDIRTGCVVRLKVPQDGKTEFEDLIRGKICFDNKLIGDQVLLKSDGYPTYHLANVVDDYLMGVTYIIRGEEWLSSTPKHLLLYKFFGWDPPKFAHLPIILGQDKKKLSKRHGAASVLEYKKQGYLPEALFNYLILLGWHPKEDKEILKLSEIFDEFTLDRIQKSPAVFNKEKLDWINGIYIRNMKNKDLARVIYDWMVEFYKSDYWRGKGSIDVSVVKLVKDRMCTLKDFFKISDFVINLPNYSFELLIFRKRDIKDTKKVLSMVLELLESVDENKYKEDFLRSVVEKFIKENNLGVGEVLHPLRVSLTGLKNSPGPFESAEALGKKESVRRIKIALEKLHKAKSP